VTVAAIYTRVSSDKQREKNTIASQTTALIDFARSRGYHVPDAWIFEDDGYSGATLIRPGLERVRDLAAEGTAIQFSNCCTYRGRSLTD
jgi:site-specific DNA recombinase